MMASTCRTDRSASVTSLIQFPKRCVFSLLFRKIPDDGQSPKAQYLSDYYRLCIIPCSLVGRYQWFAGSEAGPIYQISRRHIPDDTNSHGRRHEHLKSHTSNNLAPKQSSIKPANRERKPDNLLWWWLNLGSWKQVGVELLSVKSVAGLDGPSGQPHQTGLPILTLAEPNRDEGPWERSLPQFMPCRHDCALCLSLLLQLVS
jgi:hypothetical protein